ncbi:MAG: transcription factor S, partial [Thermoplasmata archaeon]|nr:transcription factor S [Thermoplasmata archaeon]
MICPKCKSLMIPVGEEYVCKKCGYKVKREKKDSRIVS